jgi:hypothetical protein
MLPAKIDQLQHEINTWLRALTFMQGETTNLKNRIAEVVSHKPDRKVLPQLEYYQSVFIQEDEVLALLSHDIQEQIKLLQRDGVDEQLQSQAARIQVRIRNEMEKAEMEFNKVRSSFNSYMFKVL